jgi:hypothetical protein
MIRTMQVLRLSKLKYITYYLIAAASLLKVLERQKVNDLPAKLILHLLIKRRSHFAAHLYKPQSANIYIYKYYEPILVFKKVKQKREYFLQDMLHYIYNLLFKSCRIAPPSLKKTGETMVDLPIILH